MSILIDDAFTQAFIDGAFGLSIAHENFDFNPQSLSSDAPWCSIQVVPNPKLPLSFADTDQTSGVFQIIIYYPTGKGAIAAKNKAEEIVAAFPINSSVTAGGQSARITSVHRTQGTNESGYFRIIVSVLYEAFIAR